MAKEYYDIDTIRDPDTGFTLYYVYHQYPDGKTNVVQQPFYTYQDAEELKNELNEKLIEDNKK